MNKDDLKRPPYCNQGRHASIKATIGMVLVSVANGPPELKPGSEVFELKQKGQIGDRVKQGLRFIRWCTWCDDCRQHGAVTNVQREMKM